MKIKIIGRKEIFDLYGNKHNDDGLRALNGYYEELIETKEPFDEKQIILQFEERHPEFKNEEIELKILE